jgi:hypothetical protein
MTHEKVETNEPCNKVETLQISLNNNNKNTKRLISPTNKFFS